MKPQELKRRLQGVVGFPVTPFRKDLSLDLAGLRSNLRDMLREPFCAIVAPGGTGEFYSLTLEEHGRVVRAAVKEAAGRVPLIAAVGFNPAQASSLARRARREGASGILAFPPYYPNADEEGLVEYYRSIGRATPLGLLIYGRDWFNPDPDLVTRLARIPTLIAWKDGQADMPRFASIMKRVGRRLRWIGGAGDHKVPGYYALGIRTYTSSVSNVAPRLSILLHEAACADNPTELERLMKTYIWPLYSLRARRRGYEVTVMKEMMRLIGMAAGPVRPPLPPLRPRDLEDLKALLRRWRPVLA